MAEEEPLSQGVVNIVRSFTRPILAIFGLVSWVMLFANGFDIPAAYTWLVWGMVVYYFGDRTYFKVKGGK
ncbi:unnamed protein product [marine sediment metagenome]|uniref:Uncharacterized protein n=1 Tax=marine sediment metagenome TaxID=412755 RepID=X1GFT1_9ZZZZ